MDWLDKIGEAISKLDPASLVTTGLGKLVGAIFDVFASIISDAVGNAVKEFSTMWMNVPTPDITGDGSTPVTVGGSEGILQVLGWMKWVCFSIAVIALMIAGVRFAINARNGSAAREAGHIGMILTAVVAISASAGLVSTALSAGPMGVGGAVAMVQANLWWYMQAAAVASVLIGMGRMIWQMRAEEGRNTLKSIIRLVIVAGAGPSVVSLMLTAADSFSNAVIDAAADQDFGASLIKTLIFSHTMPGGVAMVLVVGILILLGQIIQIIVMIARSGLLVLMMAVLPLASANTNTTWGQQWYQRAVGWLAAFILYKPVASIIYAICFQMVGGNAFGTEAGSVSGVLVGFSFMVMAILAMPALMKFAVPAVSAVSGGGTGGGMVAAAAPTGAMMIMQASAGRASGGRQTSSAPPTGAANAASGGHGSQSSPASAATASGTAPQSASGMTAGGGTATATKAGASGAAIGAGAAAGPAGIAASAVMQGGKAMHDKIESTASEASGSVNAASVPPPPSGAGQPPNQDTSHGNGGTPNVGNGAGPVGA